VGEANTLQAQGYMALEAGEETHGLDLLERAQVLYTQVGERVGPANIGITLANYAKARGDLAAAIAYLQPAADFCLEIGHPFSAQLQAQIEAWQESMNHADA